jgi:hypothetical protein
VLPLPDVQRGRRERLFVPEEERRRSTRIAHKAKGKGTITYLKKAQTVLMNRLGICNVEGEPPVDCLDKYAHFFEEPLPSVRIEALAKLFFLGVCALEVDQEG